MIQYPISLRDLARHVRKQFPTTLNRNGTPRRNGREAWLTKASRLSTQLKAHGSYNLENRDEIWNELKPLFARLQGGGKCAYCETMLPTHKRGMPKGDLEHYRPKQGVIKWPTTHAISVGANAPDCYYWLAFHLRNYLLACEVCNRDFKQNYFPIAGQRCSANSRQPRYLIAERPYLLHPLDPNDSAPEQLIGFEGIVPIPIAKPGTHDYWRAKVTIELLGLTNGRRLELDFERSQTITGIYTALNSVANNDPTRRKLAKRTLKKLQDNTWPHRNCARRFKRLYDDDPTEAARLAEEAAKFVDEWLHRRAQPL